MSSSPVPTQAYSTRTDLTESDKKRILAEEAVIWSELDDLGCILIDKRENGGALWVVPPKGKESIVKSTMFSLAKRFKEALQKPSLILRPESFYLLHRPNFCANDCSGYF